MASLFGLGRKKESETAENEARNEARNVTSGAGTGSGYNNRDNVASEEARNLHFEGSTGSGARSGATGSTSAFAGQNTGSSNTRTGTTGSTGTTTGTTSTTTGRTAGKGITEGFAGLNITHRSGFDTNHPVVGDTNIVCDTKYYTAVEDRPVIKEIKTYIREHHPIEKEFVVETRPTGQEREQVDGRRQEVVDTKERIVETSIPDPCGGVPTSQYSHGYSGSGSGTTGAGSYGTHNTGSTTENVKSYLPGTDANREARYEQGRGSGSSTGTGSGYTGTGGGYGAGSGASGTGSGAGGAGAGRTIS